MRFQVVSSFIDRHTKEYYPAGSVYETNDAARAEELQTGGFLGDEIKPAKGKGKSANADQRPEAQDNAPAAGNDNG